MCRRIMSDILGSNITAGWAITHQRVVGRNSLVCGYAHTSQEINKVMSGTYNVFENCPIRGYWRRQAPDEHRE